MDMILVVVLPLGTSEQVIVSDAIYPGTLFGTAVVPHSLLVQNNNPTQETPAEIPRHSNRAAPGSSS